ncbi:hypothetical protein LZ554_001241 [Drepanopeziza brunnea f. sp. 'monogermtubi']|nr:hypothetical protein LZ554_001241 [Drepanopeziza brunnea f. sp. 'monogermtubi']
MRESSAFHIPHVYTVLLKDDEFFFKVFPARLPAAGQLATAKHFQMSPKSFHELLGLVRLAGPNRLARDTYQIHHSGTESMGTEDSIAIENPFHQPRSGPSQESMRTEPTKPSAGGNTNTASPATSVPEERPGILPELDTSEEESELKGLTFFHTLDPRETALATPPSSRPATPSEPQSTPSNPSGKKSRKEQSRNHRKPRIVSPGQVCQQQKTKNGYWLRMRWYEGQIAFPYFSIPHLHTVGPDRRATNLRINHGTRLDAPSVIGRRLNPMSTKSMWKAAKIPTSSRLQAASKEDIATLIADLSPGHSKQNYKKWKTAASCKRQLGRKKSHKDRLV